METTGQTRISSWEDLSPGDFFAAQLGGKNYFGIKVQGKAGETAYNGAVFIFLEMPSYEDGPHYVGDGPSELGSILHIRKAIISPDISSAICAGRAAPGDLVQTADALVMIIHNCSMGSVAPNLLDGQMIRRSDHQPAGYAIFKKWKVMVGTDGGDSEEIFRWPPPSDPA